MDEGIVAAIRPDAISCTPIADWVDYQPYPPQNLDETGEAHVENGVRQLLNDIQTNLCGTDVAWYCRRVQRVMTRGGAEQVANFMVQFDPAFQRIEIHHIRVLRGAETIEHASVSTVQVFRRETALERSHLSGLLTASLLIPDVRIDDIVEIAVTIHGANSVLGGKYAAWAAFDPFHPSLDCRHRLVRPRTRKIATKQFNNPPEAQIRFRDGIEDVRWKIVRQPRREGETLTPTWSVQAPALQFSEFENWNEVARLFVHLYVSPDIPAALAAEIEQLADRYSDPAERAAEWLRFVQQELRYFALSLDEGGLIPRSLETIWLTRFGDCKDAARLYVAGARHMGLDACAALISTTHAPAFDVFLPSPNLFNHCIVKLWLNGKSYWLDPTMRRQSGKLEDIFQPYTGWALPLTLETQVLEKLNDEIPLQYLNDDWELSLGTRPHSPVKLRRQTQHFSWAADSLRNGIANQGASAYAKKVLNELRAIWPDINETGAVAVEDNPERNCLTSTLSYEIRNSWKPAGVGQFLFFKVVDMGSPNELALLNGTQRQTDIHLGRPRKVTRRVRMEMPRRWPGEGWLKQEQAPGIRFLNKLDFHGRSIVSVREFVTTERTLPAARAADYQRIVTKMHENVLAIRAKVLFGRIFPPGAYGWRVVFRIVWILGVLLWMLSIVSKLSVDNQ